MPSLGTAFAARVDAAIGTAAAVEIARTSAAPGSRAHTALSLVRVEFVYEASFLRVFAEWETLLEECSLRFMCGYRTPWYTSSFPTAVGPAPSLQKARQRLFAGRAYLLWHDPSANAARIRRWVAACPVESVSVTAQQWLEWLAYIRHRVAHRSEDAHRKFDIATMGLAGRRVPGGSVGRFLRMNGPSGQRWLVELSRGLTGLGYQLAP